MAFPLGLAVGLGSALGSGLFGGGSSSPFQVQTGAADAKIKELQDFGNSDITGPSQGAQLGLSELDRQKGLAIQQAAQAGQAGLSSGLSNLGIFGGAGGGAGERLARQAGQREDLGQQQLQSNFAGQRSGLLSQDLFNEQERRDRAKQQALQGELNIISAKTSGELARIGADAQRRSQRGGLFGALGGLAAGALFGRGSSNPSSGA